MAVALALEAGRQELGPAADRRHRGSTIVGAGIFKDDAIVQARPLTGEAFKAGAGLGPRIAVDAAGGGRPLPGGAQERGAGGGARRLGLGLLAEFLIKGLIEHHHERYVECIEPGGRAVRRATGQTRWPWPCALRVGEGQTLRPTLLSCFPAIRCRGPSICL